MSFRKLLTRLSFVRSSFVLAFSSVALVQAICGQAIASTPEGASSEPPSRVEHVLWAPYWTVASGFQSSLELKNNRIDESITAQISLHFTNGHATELFPVTLAGRQTMVLDLNWIVEQLRGNSRRDMTEGSLELRFEAETPLTIMGAITVVNSEWATAWNFYMFPGAYGAPNVPLRGAFWLRNKETDGFVVLHNSSEEVMTVLPRFEAESVSHSLPEIQLGPKRSFKFRLRESLKQAGVIAEASGLEFAYEGVAGTLRAQGVLFDRRGFSTEIDFLPAQSYEEPREIPLRTPRFALGKADPLLGLPRRTAFEPFLILHNFNSYFMHLDLTVGYRDQGIPLEFVIPFSLESGQTEIIGLHSYLQGVIPADEHWASLEITYTSRRRGLAAALVSVSQDGEHSIRSVMNWVQKSVRVGWYWRADAQQNTLLNIFNGNSEEIPVRVWLDFFSRGTGGSYELPLMMVPARSTYMLNIREIILSQAPDVAGTTIPADVTYGGYRVHQGGPGQAGITTEALIYDQRRKSFLTLYNTGCCYEPWSIVFSPAATQGYPGDWRVMNWAGYLDCGYQDFTLSFNATYSSTNSSVAQASNYDPGIYLAGPGVAAVNSALYYPESSGVAYGDCYNVQAYGQCSVGVSSPAVSITSPSHNPNPPDSSFATNYSFLSTSTISAQAESNPSGYTAQIQWTLTASPGGTKNHSPVNLMGASINFMPDPPAHPPYGQGGSYSRGNALTYSLKAALYSSQDINNIAQDQKDIIRQEYVNHIGLGIQLTVPDRPAFGQVQTTTHFSDPNFDPGLASAYSVALGQPAHLAQAVRDRYNQLIHDDVQVVSPGTTGLSPTAVVVSPGANIVTIGAILDTTPCNGAPNPSTCDDYVLNNNIVAGSNGIAETAAVNGTTDFSLRLTSGWRNPERNEEVGGSPTSKHQYGGAVDLVPSLSVPGKSSAQLYCILKEAASQIPGVTQAIAERPNGGNWPCTDSLVDHIHVQQ